ncbi:YeeE/YedE thiosulfate transporter family protein [uncultured Cetobacterium sp.]|uniref:YeeE/YedE thiosulfate transporter family protein n=1 Tax=uncultured Cetobacterium sp. TaxID=527638 RepID=UPI0026223063|nr:YeeE/YedE thiosulfate transporter family protein [uncultured Cetobacterium sp.]
MNIKWISKGLFLGLVFFISMLLVKPIGISTQYSITSGIIHSTVEKDIIVKEGKKYSSTVEYYNQDGIAQSIKNPFNFSMVFIVGVFIGGMIGRLLFIKNKNFIEENEKLEKDSISRSRLFVGGIILLYGARMAGGCTSGHMMSGIIQLSVSSIVFAIVMFPIAILVAKKVGE